jgi:phage shock protein PspC (stress-responsive transcriptional regulator)
MIDMTQERTEPAPEVGFDGQRLRAAPLLMRRSRSDRYIAGVCGGFAAYVRIDPVVVRVVTAALSITGAGLVLYLAAWLLVPEEGSDRALVGGSGGRADDARRIGWALAAILALGALLSAGPWFDVWFPWPLVALALIGWLWFARDRSPALSTSASPSPSTPQFTSSSSHPASPAQAAAYAATSSEPASAESTTTGQPMYPSPSGPHIPAPTAAGGAAPRRPRPRRGDTSLALLTCGMALVALGVLWSVDRAGSEVEVPAYLAAILAVVGVGLLVGSVVGNGRWLLPLAVILAPALWLSSQVTVWSAGEIVRTPRTAAELASTYELGAGRIDLDLTRIDDLDALDGRTVDIDITAGEVVVLVPEEVDLTVTASQTVGELTVLDRREEGFNNDLTLTEPDTARPNVHVVINAAAGDLEVSRP